jgi:hypothetical protein
MSDSAGSTPSGSGDFNDDRDASVVLGADEGEGSSPAGSAAAEDPASAGSSAPYAGEGAPAEGTSGDTGDGT